MRPTPCRAAARWRYRGGMCRFPRLDAAGREFRTTIVLAGPLIGLSGLMTAMPPIIANLEGAGAPKFAIARASSSVFSSNSTPAIRPTPPSGRGDHGQDLQTRLVPRADFPTYCAGKAFLHSWLQSLRYQLRHGPVEVLKLAPP